MPPLAAAAATTRFRCRLPLPQEAEHFDQLLQGETLQSTGHSKLLQRLSWVNTPQAFPPCNGVRNTLRERRRKMVPTMTSMSCDGWHVMGHSPQAPHRETAQSLGQPAPRARQL